MFEFLSQKNPVFESKNPVLVKKFGKSLKKGFPNIRKFWNLFYSKLSENYKKMTLNLNFGNRKKTCSGLKTDLKVWLKVRNAGPYFLHHH